LGIYFAVRGDTFEIFPIIKGSGGYSGLMGNTASFAQDKQQQKGKNGSKPSDHHICFDLLESVKWLSSLRFSAL